MKIRKEQTLSLRSGKATVGEGTALGRRGAGVLWGPEPGFPRSKEGLVPEGFPPGGRKVGCGALSCSCIGEVATPGGCPSPQPRAEMTGTSPPHFCSLCAGVRVEGRLQKSQAGHRITKKHTF